MTAERICFEDDDQLLFWLKGSIALVLRGRISRDLGMRQLAVLLICHTSSRRETMTTLSEKLGLRAQAAHYSINRLTGAALVRRLPHPSDKRASLIQVTQNGRALCRRLRQTI